MFILVCCLTLFFVITLLKIIKNNEGVVHKAEFIVTLDWDKNNLNDLDLWVKLPSGDIIYYKDKDARIAVLDRDDLGKGNDTVMINGVSKTILINQEIISIRAIMPGKYKVGVHFYNRHDKSEKSGTPVPFAVRMDRINPQVTIVFLEERELKTVWDEITIATFEVLPDGDVINIDLETQEPMVHERLTTRTHHPDDM